MRTPCGVEQRHKTKTPFAIANMMTDPTTFLTRQLEHRQSVLIVETSEPLIEPLAFTCSDSYHWFCSMLVALGFKVFLRTPCGVEQRHKTKTPFVIANMMTDPTTFLIRQLEHRQSVLIVETSEWTLVPLIEPLAFTCSDSYHWFFSMLCIVLTLSLYLQYIQ